MLSNIGRAAVRRVGGGAGTSNASTNRVFQSIWWLQRVDASGKVDSASDRTQFSLSIRRLYATATKATQTSKPKRATTTKATPKKSAAKKPKKLLKKAVAKKKPKKNVAAKPKPKPKPKVKKVITPEQKAKTELKALKVTALSPPKSKPSTAWMVLVSEASSEAKGSGKGAVVVAKEAAQKYRSLSPQEKEEYNHKANQNKVANAVAMKQWTESHTPEEIRLANNARHLLKKKTGKRHLHGSLKDDRIPKFPTKALFIFAGERWASGDFKGLTVVEATPLIHKEFEALSNVERKVYVDREAADKQRYIQEFKTVFRRDPEFVRRAAPA